MLSPTAAQKRLATAREKYRIYLSKHGSAVGSESHEDPTIATPQHAVVTPWRQGANEMEVASELAKLALQSPVVSTGYGDNDVTPLYDSGKSFFPDARETITSASESVKQALKSDYVGSVTPMQSNALPSPEQLEGELEHSKEKIEMLERELHIKDELLDAKIILEEKVQSEKDTRLVNIEMQLEELQHVVQDSSEMVLRTITREEKIADAKVDINVSSVGSQTEALEMELAIAQIPPCP